MSIAVDSPAFDPIQARIDREHGPAARREPSTLAIHLGSWMRHARKAARMSQTDLAQRVGSSQTGVSCWERGVDIPNFVEFVNVCRYLQCDPAKVTCQIIDAHTSYLGQGSLFATPVDWTKGAA